MSAHPSDRFRDQREAMVQLIRRNGIRDQWILDAFRDVRRDKFVPEESSELAYEDSPLPIGGEQTISQPLVVAIMAAALQLKPEDRVLEIGAGSGYAAAILSKMAKEVFTVERLKELADLAEQNLADAQIDNVSVRHADGTEGWPEHAPYDAIVVAAGGPNVPEPLLEQLKVGGRLVIPIGATRSQQKLLRLTKHEDGLEEEDFGNVRFVPLLGTSGW